MNLSLLTYNTLLNNAANKLDSIISQYHPDIICLQEALTDDDSVGKIERFGYKLADFANSFVKFGMIFGVVTFYNPKIFKLVGSSEVMKKIKSIDLISNLIRIVLGFNHPRSFLQVDLVHKPTNKKITVCNTHLFVIGSNALRIKHIDHALEAFDIGPKKYFLVAGDFNYFPYQRKKLEKIMKKYRLKEATKDIVQTVKFSYNGMFEGNIALVRFLARFVNLFSKNLKVDYVFYRGLKLKKTEKIDVRFSDHYPIISTFDI
jgi:endonuclease/exonuclease/phosphatase family metal-dependent hydrolase